MGKCTVTNKLMYPSKKEAVEAIKHQENRTARWAAKWCPFCLQHHLTSSGGPRRGKKDAQKVTRGKR